MFSDLRSRNLASQSELVYECLAEYRRLSSLTMSLRDVTAEIHRVIESHSWKSTPSTHVEAVSTPPIALPQPPSDHLQEIMDVDVCETPIDVLLRVLAEKEQQLQKIRQERASGAGTPDARAAWSQRPRLVPL